MNSLKTLAFFTFALSAMLLSNSLFAQTTTKEHQEQQGYKYKIIQKAIDGKECSKEEMKKCIVICTKGDSTDVHDNCCKMVNMGADKGMKVEKKVITTEDGKTIVIMTCTTDPENVSTKCTGKFDENVTINIIGGDGGDMEMEVEKYCNSKEAKTKMMMCCVEASESGKYGQKRSHRHNRSRENNPKKVEDITTSTTLELTTLKFYPNPNAGNFTLDFNIETRGNTTVSIFDINGKEVYKEELLDFSGNYKK